MTQWAFASLCFRSPGGPGGVSGGGAGRRGVPGHRWEAVRRDHQEWTGEPGQHVDLWLPRAYQKLKRGFGRSLRIHLLIYLPPFFLFACLWPCLASHIRQNRQADHYRHLRCSLSVTLDAFSRCRDYLCAAKVVRCGAELTVGVHLCVCRS